MKQLTTRASRVCVTVVAAVTAAVTINPTPAQAVEGPVVVSLTFDDGVNAQYDLAMGLLAEHRVKATFYLNSGRIDQRGNETRQADPMTWRRAQQLRNAGHEIGGHTLDHQVVGTETSTLTLAEKTEQICGDRDRLVQQGFNPLSFAYPEGRYDDIAIEIVQSCGYQTARIAGGLQAGANAFAEQVPPTLSPYKLRVLGSTTNGPITYDRLRTTTLAAYENGGGWLPMLFHMVCFRGNANYDACMAGNRPVDANVLDRYLTWVEGQRSISVRTISQVMANGIPPAEDPPVDPPPADGIELGSLSRDLLGQGARARVVLTGSFDATTQVRVAGQGVNARVVGRPSDDRLVVRVAVGSGAPVGRRTVRVVNGSGSEDTCDGCLRIVRGPKISALMRDTVPRGRVTWVPILGSRFNGNTVVRVSGRDVRVRSVNVIGPRKLKVALAVAPRARRTARTVTVLDRRTLGRDTWANSLRVR